MAVWIGFPSVMLPYRPARSNGGDPKIFAEKMLRLAGDGLFSFSLFPLRVALLLGLFIVLAVFELGYISSFLIQGRRGDLVPGWASIILLITVGTATNLILLGILACTSA